MAPYVRAETVEIVVSDNGSGSQNEANVNVSNETQVTQTNSAEVGNSVDATSETGGNSISGGTGDATTTTGNAQTDVSVQNTVNAQVANVDNCCPSTTSVVVSGNGSNSQNNVNLNQTFGTSVYVNQNAAILNSIAGSASSGGNVSSNNSGDVAISTGNASVRGEIINGPINVSQVNVSSGFQNLWVEVSGNASDLQNTLVASLAFQTQVDIVSNVGLVNNALRDANTGRNIAEGNSGDVDISTGDASLDFFIKNIANLSVVEIDQCCPDPPDDDGDGGVPPPTGGGGPTNPPSNGGGGPGPSGGSITSVAAATSYIPQVLGLSDTSSEAAQTLFFWVGVTMIAGGMKLIGDHLRERRLAATSS